MNNKVFIATSIDGYIADETGGIEWLESVPELNTVDSGYDAFIENVDALIMGRKSYEKVLSFGIEWPYAKPVYVLSNSLDSVADGLEKRVFLLSGGIKEVLSVIHSKGHENLYIDGGNVIQSFLQEDLIDEMIITTIPVLLGGGVSLFGKVDKMLKFECTETKLYVGKVGQARYVRISNV